MNDERDDETRARLRERPLIDVLREQAERERVLARRKRIDEIVPAVWPADD